MVTISELVNEGDIPPERKDLVKKLLSDLGYAASRSVDKVFLKITEEQMTGVGLTIADANAILAEVESLQGSILMQTCMSEAFMGDFVVLPFYCLKARL